MDKDLKLRSETIRLLETNIGKNAVKILVWQKFLGKYPTSTGNKRKNKLDYIVIFAQQRK